LVYVSIDAISFDEGQFFIDMSVMGFKPSGCIEAVELLTNVFEKMEYDYTRRDLPLSLRRLGYYIAELSRRKIYLGMVPKNTYFWSPEWKPSGSEDEQPVCVFVDVGSPLRHAYIAYSSREVAGAITYWIEGGGLTNRECLTVRADFHEGEPICTASWCDEYLEAVRDKIYSKELYIGVYPSPVDGEHRRKLKLVEEALKLAGLK
jgi:hypothetical protein